MLFFVFIALSLTLIALTMPLIALTMPLVSLTLVYLAFIWLLRWLLMGLGLLNTGCRLLGLGLLTMVFGVLDLMFMTMTCMLGLIPLDPPSLVLFPIVVSFPVVPVLFNLLVGDAFVLPGLASPVMLPVFMPPVPGHLAIKSRDMVIISPTPVVVLRTVPVTVPRTPPPAVTEKDVLCDVRNNVDIGCRQYDHLRWRGKHDEGRQLNPHLDVHLRSGRHGQNA